MIRAAFLSFYRSLTRHPLYSALNLLGLSFGIAVFIVLSLFVRFETSYEQWLPNVDRIYEVGHRIKPRQQFNYSTAGYMLDAIHQARPDLIGTRIFPVYMTVSANGHQMESTGQLVDPDFFSVFDLPVLAGDRVAALRAPDGVILTESFARKYFGRTDIVGKRLFVRENTYADSDKQVEKPWRVLAVLKDIPANSNLDLGFIRSLSAYDANEGMPSLWVLWGPAQRGRTFVMFPNQTTVPELLPTLISAFKKFSVPAMRFNDRQAQLRTRLELGLFAFSDEHLSDPRPQQILEGVVVMAILTLTIALINYSNLAIARAAGRAREAAVRRLQGATPIRLIGQLLTEAVLTGAVCLVVAFSMVEVALPALNQAARLSLKLDYSQDGPILGALSMAVIVGSILAGIVPAHVLARLRPVQILTAARSFDSSRVITTLFQNALTIVQFSTGSIFFIAIAGFSAQLKHMETSNLGFTRDHLLVTDSLIERSNDAILSQAVVAGWRRLPGIAAVTRGQIPGRYFAKIFIRMSRNVQHAPMVEVSLTQIASDYFETYDTPVLAGRPVGVSDDVGAQKIGTSGLLSDMSISVNIVVNRAAVRAFGFVDIYSAIGQDLRYGAARLHIVGVVENQRFQGPVEAIFPTVYAVRDTDAFLEDAIIRYSGIDQATARKRLETVWHRMIPDRLITFTTMRQELDYYYRDDRRNTRLFAFGGGVAALIGAVGLFGMAAFNTSARVHEIGIRKAQGASRWRIMRLLMFQFLRPVLIANIIAWPIAYLVLDGWLKQFDDRVAMSPLFFMAGSGLSILIAAVTVFGVAWSGASLSPARALRQL